MNNMQFTRSLRLSDPMSPPGENIVTILEGYGFGLRLFSLDITKQDDGTFCKCSLIRFFSCVVILW